MKNNKTTKSTVASISTDNLAPQSLALESLSLHQLASAHGGAADPDYFNSGRITKGYWDGLQAGEKHFQDQLRACPTSGPCQLSFPSKDAAAEALKHWRIAPE